MNACLKDLVSRIAITYKTTAMPATQLSQLQVAEFNRNGYIIIPNFCNKSETEKLYQTAIEDSAGADAAAGINKYCDAKTKISRWFSPADDVFGFLSRSEKMVNTIADLLPGDSPVCHVQTKLLEKKPRIGGVWEWHQDHAYWSKNEFMKASKMVGVMVSLTRMNKENGGSQLIKGSHKVGRIKHSFGGERTGADMMKVSAMLESMELVYPEMEAGDAIFFHSNLLHRADANLSSQSRWSVISCYSAQSNMAKNAPFTSWHTPVSIVPNEAILQSGEKPLAMMY